MKNPASRVRCFLSPNWRAFFVVIENDTSRAFEHFVEQWWTFFGENARGFR